MRDLLTDPHTFYFHVRMLQGMVTGFALTHLLRGLARIIERPTVKPVYWVHLIWATFTFLFLVHFWWWELRFAEMLHWTFDVVLFLAMFSLLLYLLATLVFPESMSEHETYRDYFYSRRASFFGVLAVIFLVDLYDTWLKGVSYFQSLGPEYWLRNLAYAALCVTAIVIRNPKFHGAFAIAALAYQVNWIIRTYNVLDPEQ